MGLLFILPILLMSVIFPCPTYAQCPVCVVTVGGGMLLAKKLGIDDLLVSIWISALNTAIAYYLASNLKHRYLRHPLIMSFLLYLLTLAYFQFTDQIGAVHNLFFGIDKIVLGQTIGLLAMVFGNYLYSFTKARNNHRAIFPYSKVVFPLGTVLLVTFFFKLAFNL